MARVHDISRFRATALALHWAAVTKEWPKDSLPPGRLGQHVRLVWACGEDLGTPLRPFTIWHSGRSAVPLRQVRFATHSTAEGLVVTWGGVVSGRVALVCDVRPGTTAGAFALRHGSSARSAVNVARVETNASTSVVLDVSASEITAVLLVNATAVEVHVQSLNEIINADSWQKWEIVGLPVSGQFGRYDMGKQGLITDLVPPVDAAVQRLQRAAPPVGWWPETESGRPAPRWIAPDAVDLVKDVSENFLPEVRELFRDGLAERSQWELVDRRVVESPSQGARVSDQPATSHSSPLGTLMLAGLSDVFTNLAAGFGTGYDADSLPSVPVSGPLTHVRRGIPDLMVTAEYSDCVLGRDVEVCAYIPGGAVIQHSSVPPVLDLKAKRAALLPPAARDLPFAESLDINWLGRQSTPWLTDPVGSVLARFNPADAIPAVDASPKRPAGGSGASVIATPKALENRPGSERPRMVDPGLELPLSGSRSLGYAVAQCNVFGVFSPWQDVSLTTDSPVVNGARVVSLALAAQYTTSHVCSSVVTVEVAIEWMERSPASLEVVTLFYPMPAGDTPPPNVGPGDPVPPGCIRGVRTLHFAGDVASLAGVGVEPLGEDGAVVASFGSATQGDAGRRYRLTFAGELLDYGAVSRWGVRLWLRLRAGAVPTFSRYTPAQHAPATAVAASPVPVVPQPPPPVPGVPMGSTPDAAGHSHVRVSWKPITAAGVHRIVVWEATETAMLWTLAASTPDRNGVPGERLATILAVYDGVVDPDPTQGAAGAAKRIGARRQGCFRRVMEVAPDATSADVVLPRGSRDIHLFVVTAITTTAVESEWPDGGLGIIASDHLQPVMAPELLRPSQPAVRPVVQIDGTTSLTCRAASPIEVKAFEVFATRSELAARDHLTMGPPRERVLAARSVGTDPITGAPVWEATAVGALPEHWDPWFVRAVAVPVLSVPPMAQRGLTSPPSGLLRVQVTPSAGPSLEALSHALRSADHRMVLFSSATTAPEHVIAAGEHRLKVVIDGVVQHHALHAVAAGGPGSPPLDGASTLMRGPRVDGSTPVYLWVQRARASDAIEVSVSLTDPLGRSTTESSRVEPWVAPVTTPRVKVVNSFTITGRGTILVVRTSAEAGARPPWSVSLKATTGTVQRDPFPRTDRRPPPFGREIPGRWDDAPGRRPRRLSGAWRLDDIRVGAMSGSGGREVEVVRTAGVREGTELQFFIPSAAITSAVVVLHSRDGNGSATWSR